MVNIFAPQSSCRSSFPSSLYNIMSLSYSSSFYHALLITVLVFSLFYLHHPLHPSSPPFSVCARRAGSRCWPEKDWHSEAGPLPAALTFLPDFDGAFEQRCVEGRAACLSAFQQLQLCLSSTQSEMYCTRLVSHHTRRHTCKHTWIEMCSVHIWYIYLNSFTLPYLLCLSMPHIIVPLCICAHEVVYMYVKKHNHTSIHIHTAPAGMPSKTLNAPLG